MNVDPSGRQVECLWSEIQADSGNYNPSQNMQCERLKDKLYRTFDTPTWDEVRYCYPCIVEPPFGFNPTIESYRPGLHMAEKDGMAGHDRIEMAINDFIADYRVPDDVFNPDLLGSIITTGILNGNGYIEGTSTGGGLAIASFQLGSEIVYNFATFQRMRFAYRGAGFSTSIKLGASASYYAGYVAGFQHERKCGPGDRYTKFSQQYSGKFVVTGGSVVSGVGLGITHFHSPAGTENGVRGQSVGVYFGAQASITLGSTALTYYRVYGSERTYIGVDGKVDIDSLESDILYGADSELDLEWPMHLSLPYLDQARNQAARAAIDKAILYNNSADAIPCPDTC